MSCHRESLAKAGAMLASGCALDLLIWLTPVSVLGDIGLVLLKIGTEETVVFGQTDTELTSTGWVGGTFLCFAVAVFLGRGTVRSLYRMVNAGSVLDHPWRVCDHVVGLAFATLAALVGLRSMAFAAGVLDLPDSGTPTTGFDQDEARDQPGLATNQPTLRSREDRTDGTRG